MPDVSQRQIEIRYSFTGAELLLFGAILYPGGRPPEPGTDVAVVRQGPARADRVREKQKVAGIWMNVGRVRFRSAPAFYAVASSRPLAQLVDERTAAIYELGLDNLQLSPGGGAPAEVLRRFEHGLIDLRRRTSSMPNIRAAWRSAKACSTAPGSASRRGCRSAPIPPRPS